ncbi:sodium/hydrogen exchanger 9B2-like isoform X2 [Erpetoichthys calabaricus]|uniref:sodium/hydrogen exchanger 9B2-like isoform X2 n=1 Tax=Erpetoichthys calabaricus TaxID=27687 RepID=UPI00109F2179|nr:sodium/hydrogen exchanger 9B2-like isoform X2 [Erpetoichthys calabaricus]
MSEENAVKRDEMHKPSLLMDKGNCDHEAIKPNTKEMDNKDAYVIPIRYAQNPAEIGETTFLQENGQQSNQEHDCSSEESQLQKGLCSCPPHGILANVITKVMVAALLFGLVWSVTGDECLPGGNLFGILLLLFCAVVAGKLFGLIKIPTLPPLPPLLGMLLAGFVLHNVPVVNTAVNISQKWSSSLRSIALAVILTRAGLGLDAKALRKLKAVCVRLAIGPCLTEACSVAVLSHFLLQIPWIWGFILGFVLGAVSPAVVVPSMLILQKDGYGVEQGVPTLLMAAGSFDDILAITGFNTCLGIAFSTGSSLYNIFRGSMEVVGGIIAGVAMGFFLRFFPSKDQKSLVVKRSTLLLGLAVFAVFGSGRAGFPGSGGLCTLVMSFLAGVGWADSKGVVEDIVGVAWNIFQPLLFGLIGAEISITSLNPNTVGLGVATLVAALAVRILCTFLMVSFAGFSLKEKIFVSLAWVPKATVQAAIGPVALDTAREKHDVQLEAYGMDILTVAFLSILITAPIGALAIGLAGPRLLQKPKVLQEDNEHAGPPGLSGKTAQELEQSNGAEGPI